MTSTTEGNSEATAIRVFLAIVVVILAVAVAAGALFGLAGIGVLAVIASALMLALCVVLTQG